MNHIQSKQRLLNKTILAVAIGAASSAFAQNGPRVLEEVIVTAEHRRASLQETQISMVAMNEDTIEQLGITSGNDIDHFVPNLHSNESNGGRAGNFFTIRGIGNSETLISFDPAVSTYIDGILISKGPGSQLDLLDLERVEVLRGPQGTLYGRNTIGGAVNYITNKPVDVFEAKVKATLGNYDTQNLHALVNVPLLDADSPVGELNARISMALLNRDDGFSENTFEEGAFKAGVGIVEPQDELGTIDREVFRAKLDWKPTDRFSALYSFDRTRIDEIPEPDFLVAANPDLFFGSLLEPFVQGENESDRPDKVMVDSISLSETDVDGHTLTLSWEVSENLTLESLTGYREMENLGMADADGSPVGFNSPIPRPFSLYSQQKLDSLSQEFRFLGTAFQGKIEYTAGLFYFTEEGDIHSSTVIAEQPNVDIANFETDAYAAYGQGTYDITDRLDVTFGLRYTEEEREMDKVFLLPETAFYPAIFLDDVLNSPELISQAEVVLPTASEEFTNISWMASVGYDFSDDISSYFKISTGFQSGGFNSRDRIPVVFLDGYDEEEVTNYEVGVKSRLADGRIQLNTAFFFTDFDDKRVNLFDPVNIVSRQVNAATVEIYGLEMELEAQVTDRLRAGLTYGYTHKEFKDFEDLQGNDLSDKSNFPFSPDNNFSVFLDHTYPLDFAQLRTRVDYSYRDEMTFLLPKPEPTSSDEKQLLNARITLDNIAGPADTNWRVSLWGKNLTDEAYWDFGVNLLSSFGFSFNQFGPPRTYGLDVEVEF